MMKKPFYISKIGLISYWALLPWCISIHAQDPCTGTWEGYFMKEFKTIILLDRKDETGYTGNIVMFSGENRIQDDELSRITVDNRDLTCFIAAKETTFKGTFNEQNSELSGFFIFPDQSEHPLVLKKVTETAELELTGSSIKGAPGRLIPADELKSDLMYLVNQLKRYHPRLYSYIPEPAFEERVNAVLTGLNRDLSVEQFYMMTAPVTECIKCSHTGIRLPPEYLQSLTDRGQFFPLNVYISDHSIYYLSSGNTPDIGFQPGCEIVSINTAPAGEIIDRLLSVIPSQGQCMTTKYKELNRDFPFYYYLLDPSDQYDVVFSTSSSSGEAHLNAISLRETFDEGMMALQPYSFQMERKPELGVLKLSSFGIMNMEEYFSFLDSTFRLMEKSGTPALVLDLRDNTGGHPIFAAQLFSYLTNKDFTYFIRNPEAEEFEPLYHPMQPNQHHFNGDIYVLVDGRCQSTTGHLISLLKYHTEAQFIGEEPGSSFSCNDFSIQIQLPNSGLEVNIPRTTFITDVKGFSDREPFHLDYTVNTSAEDILSGSDPCKSLVRALVLEKPAQP